MSDYTYNSDGYHVPIGTWIRATHRPQDLLPAFLSLIHFVAPAVSAQLMVNGGAIPAYAAEDDNSSWWESETCQLLVEEMLDTLNEHAPEGYYFGAHEGDGSDFGYWELKGDQL